MARIAKPGNLAFYQAGKSGQSLLKQQGVVFLS